MELIKHWFWLVALPYLPAYSIFPLTPASRLLPFACRAEMLRGVADHTFCYAAVVFRMSICADRQMRL
jgi:hypothetical protein